MFLNNLKYILTIVAFFVVNNLIGQEITILDENTQTPIANVAIYNLNKTKNQVSNTDGKIDLTNFSDNEKIMFSHISYHNLELVKKDIGKFIFLSNKSDELSEVTLSVSKTKVKKDRVAEKIAIITQKDISLLSPQTSADLLANTNGIRVQKSQGGGGSPVIRGFEANRVLLVVDNVRMNNAIYRSGHLQNSLTISPNALERTEVVFGPSSVIYGSDALGGVVHFYTKNPKINNSKKISGASLSRYSSANNEITQSFDLELSQKNWASYTNISLSDFGDIRMGKNRRHGFDNWGLVNEYSNNTESCLNNDPVINEKPFIQKNTGYSQLDVLQKFNIKITNTNNVILNFQYSESSDIPRFDRLNEFNNGTLKFAEWHYGPQKRLLFSPQYQFHPNLKWLNSGTITLAYQNVKESRIKRRFGNLERSHQNENVDVFSVNTDFKVNLREKRNLLYGLEFTYNDVDSNAYGEILRVQGNNVEGVDELTKIQSRYPDGGSSYTTAAFYTNYRQDINNKMTLNTGARFTYTKLKARFIDQTFINLPEKNLELDNSSFTANVGLTYKPTKLTRFNTVISSGFRSPNIDDIGKLREKSGLLTVPNINLKPEFAYNGEIGVTKFIKNKNNQIQLNGFYTLLNRYISRTAFIVENDNTTMSDNTVIYDNEEVETIANTNGNSAYIIGGSLDLVLNPYKNFFVKGNATYTKGKTYDTKAYLPSILPFFCNLGIEYKNTKTTFGINWQYSSKKRADEYSLGGEDNLDQTPLIDPDPLVSNDEYYAGLPSWQTINAIASYQVNKNLRLQIQLDNIFDEHYKELASSISAPGRNLRTTLNINF